MSAQEQFDTYIKNQTMGENINFVEGLRLLLNLIQESDSRTITIEGTKYEIIVDVLETSE